MKNIEISTSNHVAIEYELATTFNRVVASIIDFAIIIIWLTSTSNSLFQSKFIDSTTELIVGMILMIPFVFYSFFCELILKGQTVGKLVLGIKVVKMDGKNPGFSECTIRWAFRLVDIWGSAGALAFLMISSSEKAQRIGDVFSNTMVINLRPKNVYTLNDVLSIKDSSKYTPVYPAVTTYTDEDMLVIKNILDRLKKYPNKNTKELVKEMSSKVKEKIKVNSEKIDDQEFLRTVLQDYIVLTRS